MFEKYTGFSAPIRSLLVCAALALALLPAPFARAVELTLPDPLAEELSEGRLATWENNLVETGVGRNAIPAILNPRFLDVEDASLVLDDKDVVFVADYGAGDVRIYPQNILVWHQVVNDVTKAKENVAVTYCPLTGTLAGYKVKLDAYTLRFGVTGDLVNNNSILYDRSTDSRWPQLLGIAMSGPLKGKRLQRFPLVWTTWAPAQKAFPDASVLSRSTGHNRSYDRDPYGDYKQPDSYYDDDMIVYSLSNWDKRLPPKERIYAVRADNGQSYAVRKALVARKGILNFYSDLTPVAALHDPELDVVRVFERRIQDQPLTLELVGGEIRDKESKSIWNANGICVSGAWYGEKLQQVTGIDSFWFAFAAFHPSVEIIPPLEGAKQW